MLQNKSPLNLQISVYKLSIIKTGEMDSKVAKKCKRDDQYSNMNNILSMFKGTLMLITEVRR